MYGNSKREKIDTLIRRAVHEAICEIALSANTEQSSILQRYASEIKNRSAAKIAYDPYRMRELQDIMHWKAHPKV